MNIRQLRDLACDKTNFDNLEKYIDFACKYLEFAGAESSLQAVIVSQNEQHYRFFQYKADGDFQITRPLNSRLFINVEQAGMLREEFLDAMKAAHDISTADDERRALICNAVYTIQQTIGATLDALPAGRSNAARKINGDLFERLIHFLIRYLDVDCKAGTIKVPVMVDGVEQFKMTYQHDLIVRKGEVIKAIGGVKTSSKDRLDKIFMDKFLYCKLTGTDIPHVAIFLNDVQRKRARPDRYGISATFLPGHFKGYTVKLNPLDGVYYCDVRPNMQTDPMLRKYIRTIDHFFCEDLWRFVEKPGGEAHADIEPTGEIPSV